MKTYRNEATIVRSGTLNKTGYPYLFSLYEVKTRLRGSRWYSRRRREKRDGVLTVLRFSLTRKSDPGILLLTIRLFEVGRTLPEHPNRYSKTTIFGDSRSPTYNDTVLNRLRLIVTMIVLVKVYIFYFHQRLSTILKCILFSVDCLRKIYKLSQCAHYVSP